MTSHDMVVGALQDSDGVNEGETNCKESDNEVIANSFKVAEWKPIASSGGGRKTPKTSLTA